MSLSYKFERSDVRIDRAWLAPLYLSFFTWFFVFDASKWFSVLVLITVLCISDTDFEFLCFMRPI